MPKVQGDAPVEKPVTPVEVTGTVKENATERKFEWNTGRLFYHQEGHSQTRTWAVRVLSVLFVLPVVLTALVDLGRGLGYLVGNKVESVGKIFTGKSWSLIDEVSSGVKAVADKVNATYKAYTTPKTLTTEEMNQQSEKAMKAQVKKLIDGYKALNGGYFHTNGSFSSPAALNGEKRISAAQNELVKLVDEYVARNASGTEDFAAQLKAAKAKVDGFIAETAKDELYVENKVERKGPHPFLRDFAFHEFLDVLADSKTIPDRFIAIAKAQTDVPAALKSGVDQKIITPAQAKQVVQELAPAVYAQGLESGIVAAQKAEKAFLDAAQNNKLVTAEEADEIGKGARPTVGQLAAAAAKDIAKAEMISKAKTPAARDAIIDAQLGKAADQLIKEKKLDPKDRTEFFVQAKKQLNAAKDAVEADVQVQKKAQEEAELKAKQAAEEAEAKRVASVKKAEDQVSLLGKFKELLDVIAKKQAELDTQFKTHAELEAERERITALRTKIRETTVTVKERTMTVLEAAAVYEADVDRISSSKALTDAQKEQQMKELGDGYGMETIAMIKQLGDLTPQLLKKIEEMAAISEKIKTQHDKLIRLIAVYNVYAKNNKDKLEEANRKEVNTLEKKVFETQIGLNKQHDLLLLRGVIARLRTHAPVVNVDKTGNLAEVDAILAADKAGDPASKPIVRPTIAQRARRLGGQLAYPITGSAGWLWSKVPSIRKVAPAAK